MKRLFVLGLLLVALSLSSACTSRTATTLPPSASTPQATPTPVKEDPLKERAHINTNFTKLTIDNPTWGDPMKYAALIALLVSLFCILVGEREVARWIVIMVSVLLWGVLTDAVLKGIRNAWPEVLTQKLIDETVGWGLGILPRGDINPVGAGLARWTADLTVIFLEVVCGLICWWFFLMPIPWLVENILHWRLGSKRLQVSLLGIWFGMFWYRLKLPSILAEETLKLHRQKFEVVSSIPGVKEIGEALLNTILGTGKGLNLRFAGVWAGYTFGLLVVFGVLAIVVSFAVVPAVIGGVERAKESADRLRRDFSPPRDRAGRESRDGRGDLERRLGRLEEKVATSTSSSVQRSSVVSETKEPPPPGYVVQKDSGLVVPERYTQPQTRTRNEGLGGNQKPGSGKDPKSGNSPSGLRGTAQRAGTTLADLGSGGLASKVTKDPGGVLQTAGGVATVAGHPEAGVPLVAAGAVVSAKTNQSATSQSVAVRQQSPGPNQDPKIATDQAEVSGALEDFAAGTGKEA